MLVSALQKLSQSTGDEQLQAKRDLVTIHNCFGVPYKPDGKVISKEEAKFLKHLTIVAKTRVFFLT